MLKAAVCVAIAAAARACCLSALPCSPPGSAYSYISTEPVLVHEKQIQCVYAVQEVGLGAVHPGLFMWCFLAVKWLEAAREAETGRVLFASVSIFIKGHVFVENGLRGAM